MSNNFKQNGHPFIEIITPVSRQNYTNIHININNNGSIDSGNIMVFFTNHHENYYANALLEYCSTNVISILSNKIIIQTRNFPASGMGTNPYYNTIEGIILYKPINYTINSDEIIISNKILNSSTVLSNNTLLGSSDNYYHFIQTINNISTDIIKFILYKDTSTNKVHYMGYLADSQPGETGHGYYTHGMNYIAIHKNIETYYSGSNTFIKVGESQLTGSTILVITHNLGSSNYVVLVNPFFITNNINTQSTDHMYSMAVKKDVNTVIFYGLDYNFTDQSGQEYVSFRFNYAIIGYTP